MNVSIRILLIATCTALLMGIGLSAPAVAQERSAEVEETPVPPWVRTFGKQVKTSLESDNSLIVQQALHHVTYFATYYDREIDFSDVVPTLVDMYKHDDDANIRLFALVGLYAIGDEDGMQQVRRSMYRQTWPPRLQMVTLAALTSYYGPDTFNMDREAAEMAKNLMAHYTRPRIEVGPMEVVGPVNEPDTPE